MEDEQRRRLQDQVNTGHEAAMFLRYLDESKYFLNVLAKCETDLANKIMALSPDNTVEFTVLQAQRLSLYEPLKMAQSDKYFGELAQLELDGTAPQGGIL